MRGFSNLIGFDDAPAHRLQRPVLLVGAVYSGPRLVGVLSGEVSRDGGDAADVIARIVRGSQFHSHTQAILLQGIAMAGFNVVDIHALRGALDIPVLVVARRRPRMDAIREALLRRVPQGEEKWALIEKAGPMERLGRVYVQRAGMSVEQAVAVLRDFSMNGVIPEPLRTAHLIAGGIARGRSRGRT